jgi:hypothetical protein
MNINLIIDSNEPTLLYAAIELRSYLTLLDLDLSFSINAPTTQYHINLEVNPDLTSYGLPKVCNPYLDDQYYINISADQGHIIGSNTRSVLLGVYRYLHLIGFRFLYPDKKYDYIPPLLTIEQLYVNYHNTADERHRGICIEGANSIKNILDFIEWMPKIGFNSFFIQFRIPYTFMARWYHHELNPYFAEENIDESIIHQYSDLIDDALATRSLLHHRVGHGWTSEAIGYPSLGWMNADTNIQDNIKPLLAKINGKRELFHGVPMNTNLCYANSEVIERFTESVVVYAKEHTEVDYLHIWIADEPNNICECEECIKTTPSDQYVSILNIIDEKLTLAGLTTHLVFLLYQELLWAPKKERLRNPKRFTLMFAPITRTFEKSYPVDIACVNPPKYIRNKINLPTNIEENISFLREWQKVFSGDSFVYDYPLGRAHYGDLGYMGIAKIISDDIKNLGHLDMNGYISCQELRAGLPNAFPNYVMGYTLFHKDVSFDHMQAEYFKHAYGDDFSSVISYLSDLSMLCSPDYFNGKGSRYSKDLYESYETVFNRVKEFQTVIKTNVRRYESKENKPAPNNQVHKFFWKLLDYHAEYSLRLTKALSSLASSNLTLAKKHWSDFHRFICNNEGNHQASLDVYRVTEVGTKYTGFQL